MSVGKILGWIRRTYNTVPNTIIFYGFIIIILGSVAGILVDHFFPFTLWWNVLRALIAVPLAAAIFVIGYIQALILHNRREETTPGWISFRDRFSPTVRRRAAAIVAAVLVVISYASSGGPLYTVITALILATAFSLLAFIRLTGEEKVQEAYGLPDSRDIAFEQRLKKVQEDREKVEAKVRQKKAAKRKKLLTLGAISEEEVEVLEVEED